MNHNTIRDVFIETRKITRGSTASVAGIALILLTAALLAIGQSNGTVDRAEITANGTFTSVPSANIGQQSVGDCSSAQPTHCLDILSRYSVNSFTGSLAGTSVSLQTIARDDVTEKKAFQTNTASFWGTLNGLNGGFSTIAQSHSTRRQTRDHRGHRHGRVRRHLWGRFIKKSGSSRFRERVSPYASIRQGLQGQQLDEMN